MRAMLGFKRIACPVKSEGLEASPAAADCWPPYYMDSLQSDRRLRAAQPGGCYEFLQLCHSGSGY